MGRKRYHSFDTLAEYFTLFTCYTDAGASPGAKSIRTTSRTWVAYFSMSSLGTSEDVDDSTDIMFDLLKLC